MKPMDVADVLEQAGNDALTLSHDIRQRITPDYSNVDKENLSTLEVARVKAIGEIITPVMEHAFGKPPVLAAPQTTEPTTQNVPQTPVITL